MASAVDLSDPIVCSGWLQKAGSNFFRVIKWRFCVLRSKTLQLFDVPVGGGDPDVLRRQTPLSKPQPGEGNYIH